MPEHRRVQVPAGRTDGMPRRDDARTLHPSTSIALMRATSRKAAGSARRARDCAPFVKPARRVRRALAAPRRGLHGRVFRRGTRGLAWLGPPITRLTSMSMRPGSTVTSPKSTVVVPEGTVGGETAGDAALAERGARLDQSFTGGVEHPGTDQVDRGLGVRIRCSCRLLRGARRFLNFELRGFLEGEDLDVTAATGRSPRLHRLSASRSPSPGSQSGDSPGVSRECNVRSRTAERIGEARGWNLSRRPPVP